MNNMLVHHSMIHESLDMINDQLYQLIHLQDDSIEYFQQQQSLHPNIDLKMN
jgi:hypothetical protein